MADIDKPKVFISYTWTNDEYINKVVDFAKRLRTDGVDVVLDQFQMKLGNDMNNFMEKCVKDPTITNVLILLTPDYKTKADSRKGGAGIETQIISGEVYRNVGNTKFIPILFEKRGENYTDCIPTYLKQRRWLDMSEDSDFESQYIELVRTLYGKSKFVENPLGSKPEWLDDATNVIVNSQKVVNSFKSLKKEYGEDRAIYSSFDSLLTLLKDVRVDFKNQNSFNYEDFEKLYSNFDILRESYLSFLNEIKFDINVGHRLHNYFSDFYKFMSESRNDNGTFVTFARIYLHEVFIETISILFKCRNYLGINEITSVPYLDYFSYKNDISYFHDIFYSISKDGIYSICDFLGRALQADPKRGPYYSGIAEYWKRHLPVKYVNLLEFANADCLLTNIAISKTCEYWFACSYVYLPEHESNAIREIAVSLKSKKLAKEYYVLFDCNNVEDMKLALKNMEQYSRNREFRLGYSGAFYTMPLLIDIIKEVDLESI